MQDFGDQIMKGFPSSAGKVAVVSQSDRRVPARHKADLMMIGLHQHDFYVATLWSTVYELAQEAPCSILGVH